MTKNLPLYHGKIDMSKFTAVQSPQERRKVMALGVSESGHLTMNDRLLSKIQNLKVELCVSDDKKMILINENGDGSYPFPKNGRLKDEVFVESLADAGLAIPCRYIISYSDKDKLWVGEYTDILGNGKQSLQHSVNRMVNKKERKKRAR